MQSRIALAAVCLTFVLGCASGNKGGVQPPPLPEGWERVEVGPVSLSLPPDLPQTDVEGVGGIVRQYRNESLEVNVHYGDFASTLTEFENAGGSFEWLEISGKRARGTSAFIDQKAVDGLYFPEPGKEREPFSVLAISLTPAAREQAMLILQSVKVK